ncbi:hypothetical protein HU200_064582 [Digitaria exilis]|nr:hypothetical protein HU200_064582 [Digitaria exilis]
MAGKLLP